MYVWTAAQIAKRARIRLMHVLVARSQKCCLMTPRDVLTSVHQILTFRMAPCAINVIRIAKPVKVLWPTVLLVFQTLCLPLIELARQLVEIISTLTPQMYAKNVTQIVWLVLCPQWTAVLARMGFTRRKDTAWSHVELAISSTLKLLSSAFLMTVTLGMKRTKMVFAKLLT